MGSAVHTKIERRRQQRLYERFPAVVRCVDGRGEVFHINAALDNISAGGLYLRLRHEVGEGAQLSLVTRITTAATEGEVRGPVVAIEGRVLRAEPQPDGQCGVAVAILHHKFLPNSGNFSAH